MNLIFPTIVLFIVFLPGIIFRRLYFSQELSLDFVKRNGVEEIIKSISIALLFHIIWLFAIRLFNYKINFVLFGSMFYALNEKQIFDVFSNIQQNLNAIICYNLSINLFAILAGHFGRVIIRKSKIDVTYRYFRFDNKWKYIFEGDYLDFDELGIEKEFSINDVLFTQIDVLVKINNGTTLYRGILIDFQMNDSGSIDYIVLNEPKRQGLCEQPIPIPSNLFIIKYSEILNININYALKGEEEEESVEVEKVIENQN